MYGRYTSRTKAKKEPTTTTSFLIANHQQQLLFLIDKPSTTTTTVASCLNYLQNQVSSSWFLSQNSLSKKTLESLTAHKDHSKVRTFNYSSIAHWLFTSIPRKLIIYLHTGKK